MAGRLGVAAGITPVDVVELQNRLLAAYGLPLASPIHVAVDAIVRALARDKKAEAGTLKWVLLDRLGHATWGHELDQDMVREAITAALEGIAAGGAQH